ncbi:MAG: hypothetical protein KKA79_10400, partial [Nanoarchaeota archaeon]|nr:hypothetical protein [Nanoarchaeota archaeon]
MRKIIFVSLIYLMSVVNSLIYAEEKIPMPEFYSIYFVSHGKLIPVEKEAKEERRLKMVGDAFDTVFGISELSGVSLASDFYFLVYGQNEMTVMRRLKLGKFKFVEQVRLGTLEKSWRQANMWIVEKDIAMNSGPIKGVSDLYRFVPVSPLSNGVYALYMFPPTGFDSIGMPCVIVDFVVGKILETQLMPAKIPSPKPSETPEKITMDSLTRNLPYGNYNAGEFREIEKTYNVSFDDAWAAVNNAILKDREEITTSERDKDKGALIGQGKCIFWKDCYKWTVAIIERITEYSVKITIKSISYRVNTYETVDGVSHRKEYVDSHSDIIHKNLEKELKSKVKQPPYFVTIEAKEYKVSG